jgi:hypothetical protein
MNAHIQEIHDFSSREFRDAMALYHDTFRGALAEKTDSILSRLKHFRSGREHLLVARFGTNIVGFTLCSYIVSKNYGFISYICAHP